MVGLQTSVPTYLVIAALRPAPLQKKLIGLEGLRAQDKEYEAAKTVHEQASVVSRIMWDFPAMKRMLLCREFIRRAFGYGHRRYAELAAILDEHAEKASVARHLHVHGNTGRSPHNGTGVAQQYSQHDYEWHHGAGVQPYRPKH